jgi:hypothetical protein
MSKGTGMALAALSNVGVRRAVGSCLLAGMTCLSPAAFAAGTALSIDGTATVVCRDDGSGIADVTFDWSVTSSGSADSAEMTGQVDDQPVFGLPTIASGNVTGGGGWTFAGRMKTADDSFTAELANGPHAFTVCATQSGANGRLSKTACTTLNVTVECDVPEPKTCAETAFFGEVVGNPNLCVGNGPTINVQAEGDFGESPTLTMKWPNDDENSPARLIAVDHAGNSCNYIGHWKTKDNNGGAGAYLFTISGNDLTKTTSVVLENDCKN